MAYKNPEDQKRAARAHYEANKAAYKARAVAHRARTRQAMRDHLRTLKDVPCTDCGERYPYYVMQFDHVTGVKDFTLGGSVAASQSLKRVQEEAAKCEVVCANCHAIRTHSRGQRFSVRTIATTEPDEPLF